jgi:hypothetical protein
LPKVGRLLHLCFATDQMSHPILMFVWAYFFVVMSSFACCLV